METLAPLPTSLSAEHVPLVTGLFAGDLAAVDAPSLPGRGRARRWWYSAAATPGGEVAVGAAVVDLGLAGTSFVWVALDGRVVEASRRLFGRAATVGDQPAGGATATARGWRVEVRPDAGLLVEIADVEGEPLRVDLQVEPVVPAVCATATPDGGWNVTQKSAGHAARGQVSLGGRVHELDGLGWADWTHGRQDRHTEWRWAAGAGRLGDGRAVGLNASTGMNGAGAGEDVLWLDGRPLPLLVDVLEPVAPGRFEGPWVVSGPGWRLDFEPTGVRAARENLVVVRSSYVQPVGRFHGTLPDGAGGTIEVDRLPGVTEDHEAVW